MGTLTFPPPPTHPPPSHSYCSPSSHSGKKKILPSLPIQKTFPLAIPPNKQKTKPNNKKRSYRTLSLAPTPGFKRHAKWVTGQMLGTWRGNLYVRGDSTCFSDINDPLALSCCLISTGDAWLDFFCKLLLGMSVLAIHCPKRKLSHPSEPVRDQWNYVYSIRKGLVSLTSFPLVKVPVHRIEFFSV